VPGIWESPSKKIYAVVYREESRKGKHPLAERESRGRLCSANSAEKLERRFREEEKESLRMEGRRTG